MTIKKMLLLGAMALAAMAVAVPGTASAADQWTDNDVPLGEWETANQAFEGFLLINGGPNGTFGCQVTIEITAEAGSHGRVTKFNPTTSTCVGSGPAFTGCVLTHTTSNIATAWRFGVTTTPGTITTAADLTIHNEYHGCPVATSHLEFPAFSVTPTLNGQDTITALTIQGFATSGVFISGTVTPEESPTLGLTTTP